MRISDWSSDVCSSDLLQEHRHLGVGAAEGVLDESLTQAVRRVRDDIRCTGAVVQQEVDATRSVAPVDQIRTDDLVALFLEHPADRAVAAGRLPDRPLEPPDREEDRKSTRLNSRP